MQKKDILTIRYGKDIQILRDGKRLAAYPYGFKDSQKFNKIKSQLLEKFTLKTEFDFPPLCKVLNDKKHIKVSGFPARNYQVESISTMFGKGRATGILKAPTGAGKGSIIAYMIAVKNISTIVIVPTSDLVIQTADRIRSLLDIDDEVVGEIGEKKKNLEAPIIVSTWQSLATDTTFNTMKNKGFGMLICDEVHKASADVLGGIIENFSIPLKYGMSATPYRTQEEQMNKVFRLLGNIVHTIDILELYKEGFLLRPQIILHKTGMTVSLESGIRSYYINKLAINKKMRFVFAKKVFESKSYSSLIAGDRTIGMLAVDPSEKELRIMASVARDDYIAKVDDEPGNAGFNKKLGLAKGGIEVNPKRMDMSIDISQWFFIRENEKGVVLFHTKKAGEAYAKRMREKGYDNVYVVNGDHPNKSGMISKFVRGEIANYIIVSTVSLLSEGNDIPSLEKVFIGAAAYPPFTDVGRMQQIIGRAVRPDINNEHKSPIALILDDVAEGWIVTKKEIVMEHIDREFKPEYINAEDRFTIITPQSNEDEIDFSSYTKIGA